MKKLLSLLLVYVFLQVQTWAHSGGPSYGTAANGASAVGTYAGVLIPTIASANSLGVFGIVVPQVGLATGAFVYFAQGDTFIGAAEGEANPQTLVISALLSAQANVTALEPTSTTVNGTPVSGGSQVQTFPIGFANGSLYATVTVPNAELAGAVVLLEGKASLAVQQASTVTGLPTGVVTNINMIVQGYEQTTDTSTTFDLSNFTTATSGSAGSSSTGS